MNFCTRAALVLVALAFATPALADNCRLTQLASIDMQPTSDDDVVLVPASINGAHVQLLLDTGGGVSNVTEKTVEALKLTPQESDTKLLDLYGNASRRF